jgi:hypothetical protein
MMEPADPGEVQAGAIPWPKNVSAITNIANTVADRSSLFMSWIVPLIFYRV